MKTKLAMALRLAWMCCFSRTRFRVATLGSVTIGNDNLHEMLATVRTKLKGEVVVVEEKEKKVMEGKNFQFQNFNF